MEFDLLPGITLRSGSFNAVIAPEPVIAGALNANEHLSRFTFLLVSGPSSRILSSIHHRSPAFDMQRADTAGEFKSVIATAGHTILFIEYSQSWYENSGNAAVQISSRLKELAGNALVLLYAEHPDRFFDQLCRESDRLFVIWEYRLRLPPCSSPAHHPASARRPAYRPQQSLMGELWVGVS